MAIIPGVRALECVEERPRTTGIKTETPGGRILIYHIRALGVRVLQKPRMLGLFVVVVVVVVFLSFCLFSFRDWYFSSTETVWLIRDGEGVR